MRSVGSRRATGSELDEAPGDVSSASRLICAGTLSLTVACMAERFPPRLTMKSLRGEIQAISLHQTMRVLLSCSRSLLGESEVAPIVTILVVSL